MKVDTVNLSPHLSVFLLGCLRKLRIIKKKSFLKRYKKYRAQICEKNILFPAFRKRPKEESDYFPHVTVIVPNYNHAPYLKERLESIYNQTYKNYDVILMDDLSTDGSQHILLEYKNRYSKKTTLVLNESNSGSPYKQWRKGLDLARGELIWIAESDDYCDLDFLEHHVRNFSDKSIMLSYSFSEFVSERNGSKSSTSLNLADCINPREWDEPFVLTSHLFVNHFLSKKNVIINVSSCLFRNMDFSIYDNSGWDQYKLCGDWIFYLNIIAGGKVAYTNATKNYYRIHESSTSLSEQKKLTYFSEHEKVALHIAKNYKVQLASLLKMAQILKTRFESQPHDKTCRFEDYYDIRKIKEATKHRKPNIMQCCFAFCAGGGETFPMTLANGLKKRGYAVTIFNLNAMEASPGIDKKILPNIPIVSSGDIPQIIEHYGIDIVHSHHALVDTLVMQERLINDKFRHFVTLHGMYETINNFDEDIFPKIFAVDAWSFVAEKNVSQFKAAKLFSENSFTEIHNATEKTNAQYSTVKREDFRIDDESFIIVMASRGIKSKGWNEAIAAVQSARQQTELDIHLILVGDGELYDQLKNRTAPYVHMVGFKNNVSDYLRMGDLTLVASTFKGESFPLVILESLEVGRPVLSTNIGEIPSMIRRDEHDAGKLIELTPSGAIPQEKLVKSIIELAVKGKLYNELKNNCRYVIQQFDYDAMIQKYMDAYDRALA